MKRLTAPEPIMSRPFNLRDVRDISDAESDSRAEQLRAAGLRRASSAVNFIRKKRTHYNERKTRK